MTPLRLLRLAWLLPLILAVSVRAMRPALLAAGLLLTGFANLSGAAETGPRPRPAEWAVPVINGSLENCYRVSDELYRCEQPGKADLADLHALGVRSILNLRNHHTDSPAFATAGFKLLVEPMSAGEVSVDNLVAALRQLRAAPKPVLVHCWHGSDRTGSVVAAYRIVFQNWTPAAALDELRHGGFGFHETWFPNIVTLFQTLDAAELRRRVLE